MSSTLTQFHWSINMHHSKVSSGVFNSFEYETLTRSQRIADSVVRTMGSWKFILTQTVILTFWTILNFIVFIEHWDPYPFILLNLILSLQAAYAAPMIMMSQNRQAARDRIEAHNDFLINKKAETEVRVILERLEEQKEIIHKMHRMLLAKEKENTSLSEFA